MSELEQFIRENREAFDSIDPLDGHLERFSERLDRHATTRRTHISNTMFLKVAALILLFITGTVLVFDLISGTVRSRLSSAEDMIQMPADLTEAIRYYDTRAKIKLSEVRTLSTDRLQADQINADALKEINSLDAGTRELQESLAENPNNDRLQAALIQHQQMKEGVVNTIVSKIAKR